MLTLKELELTSVWQEVQLEKAAAHRQLRSVNNISLAWKRLRYSLRKILTRSTVNKQADYKIAPTN
ncbi:MAG: hypothetical protein GY796_09865 [Chloroflexi bacterium]|nr:hypothetical protein [Chloroflexota bacterium]